MVKLPHVYFLLGGIDIDESQLFEEHVELETVELDVRDEMVQVFMVVQCYSCKTFQVHQVSRELLIPRHPCSSSAYK